MNAGFVAKVDKSTMTVNIVRIVYGGIEPHTVSALILLSHFTEHLIACKSCLHVRS